MTTEPPSDMFCLPGIGKRVPGEAVGCMTFTRHGTPPGPRPASLTRA